MNNIRVYFLVLCLIGSAVNPVLGQGEAEALFVRSVIAKAEGAVENLMSEGFYRFDSSVINTAMQARATINQASLVLRDVSYQAVDDLDGQQRRAVSDLQSLTAVTTEALRESVQDVVTPIQQNLQLLTGNAGYVAVRGGYATRGDESLDISLQGTALSKAEIRDFSVAGVRTLPDVRLRDDDRIAIRIPLDEGPAGDVVRRNLNDDLPIEIPVSLSLEECWLWGLWCSNERELVVEAVVLPRILGRARAFFAGEVEVEERESKTLGPFSSGRVRSSIEFFRIRRGRRTDRFTVRPDDGWRIDVGSARISDFTGFRECAGHSASFIGIDESALTVHVVTRTVSEPWVNCQTQTTISFDQVRIGNRSGIALTDAAELVAGKRLALQLSDEVELENVRLAHVEIESVLFPGGALIVRRDEARRGVRVEFDPANPGLRTWKWIGGGSSGAGCRSGGGPGTGAASERRWVQLNKGTKSVIDIGPNYGDIYGLRAGASNGKILSAERIRSIRQRVSKNPASWHRSEASPQR